MKFDKLQCGDKVIICSSSTSYGDTERIEIVTHVTALHFDVKSGRFRREDGRHTKGGRSPWSLPDYADLFSEEREKAIQNKLSRDKILWVVREFLGRRFTEEELLLLYSKFAEGGVLDMGKSVDK